MFGNDQFTKVLNHFDGTNGSTTITDNNAGGSAHTWTARGLATISTAASEFGGASLTCNGVTDYADTADSADFTLGTNDFTVDCWFNISGGSGTTRYLSGQVDTTGASANQSFGLAMLSSNKFYGEVYSGSTAKTITGTTVITAAGWHHGALVRTGNTLKLFLDGVQEGGDLALGSFTINDSAFKLAVGRLGEFNGFYWNGFIDEFRLSNGIARWTSNFTPPNEPYDVPAFWRWQFNEPDFGVQQVMY